MIVAADGAGLGRRGLDRTDHNPRRGNYGIGRTDHNPRGRGWKGQYGVGGPWGDVLRDVVGDVANTGLDIWRGREGMPDAGSRPAPVVVVQQQPSSGFSLDSPIVRIALAAGAAWAGYRLGKRSVAIGAVAGIGAFLLLPKLVGQAA